MIYFLYGADTYRSRKKLSAIFEEYRKKWGSNLNVEKFDAEVDDIERILAAAENQSLFVGKKLVIVERFFSAESGPSAKKGFARAFEKLEKKLSVLQTSQDTIVLFWDGEIGAEAKKELKQFLKYVAKSEEFELLAGEALQKAIVAEARKRGITVSSRDVNALVARYGSDIWAIAGELDKAEVAGSLEITSRMPIEDKIYKLTDAVVDGKKEALFLLKALLESGINELYILGALRNGIRGLLLASEAVDEKRPIGEVEKFLGIHHPFVLKKMQAQARTHSFEALKKLYENVLAAEQEMKGSKVSNRDALEIFVERALEIS
ncbi:DNA polymerase III subunit delta [Patescibacteria group bacterium]|nr:DNA polymerase III subunit delta [Patescibacteria group bacterium]